MNQWWQKNNDSKSETQEASKILSDKFIVIKI